MQNPNTNLFLNRFPNQENFGTNSNFGNDTNPSVNGNTAHNLRKQGTYSNIDEIVQ